MKLSTRLMLAMVALALLSATIVGVWTYRNVYATVMPRALAGIEARARLLALDLESSVRGARADVLGFRSAVAVDGIIRASAAGGTDPVGGTTAAQWRDRLAARFAAELAAKPDYRSFRIITARRRRTGNAACRHVAAGAPSARCPTTNCSRAASRDFYQRGIRLAPGEVDISPIDLARRAGRDRRAACAGAARDRGASCAGRQAVRHHHDQPRSARRLRPPARRRRSRHRLPRERTRRLSHSPRPGARVRVRVRQAAAPAGRLSRRWRAC